MDSPLKKDNMAYKQITGEINPPFLFALILFRIISDFNSKLNPITFAFVLKQEYLNPNKTAYHTIYNE